MSTSIETAVEPPPDDVDDGDSTSTRIGVHVIDAGDVSPAGHTGWHREDTTEWQPPKQRPEMCPVHQAHVPVPSSGCRECATWMAGPG